MNYQQLASKGRFGDTELYNINRKEATLLRALGGSGTINPNTGLREYSHKWYHPGGTIGGWLDSAVDSGSSVWNNTWGNQGIGGMMNNQNPIGGWANETFGPMWNNTIGNQGIGGMFGDVFSGMFGGGVSGDSPGSSSNWSQGPGPKPGYPAQPPQSGSMGGNPFGGGWGGFSGNTLPPRNPYEHRPPVRPGMQGAI